MSNRNDTVPIVANDSYIEMSNRNGTVPNVLNNTNTSVSFAIQMVNSLGEFSEYYIPIFVCLSLLVNSLSVYVFFCTKLRYSSSSIYLGALAISDIGVLIMIFEDWFELRDLIDVYWLQILFTCSEKLFDFLSLWIIVVFIVQQYKAMKWPLLRRSLDTVNRAKIVVIGLAVLAVLISIPKFIILFIATSIINNDKEMMKDSMNSTNNEEKYENKLLYLSYLWTIYVIFDVIITFILPTTIIAILNALIVHNIRKHKRIQRNLILSSAASNKKTQSSDNETSHIEVTKMLVIISSIIICLNTPFQISLLVFNIIKIAELSYTIWIITLSLWLTNYGINFFLHCATGKNFRKELIRIFTKRSNTRRNEDIENY